MYWLDLLDELNQIHIIFHVSQLRKCLDDDFAIVQLDDIHVDECLHYVERQITILDRKTNTFCNQVVGLFKVKWWHHKVSK